MSTSESTAATELGAAPPTAPEAQAQLALLSANPEWAGKLMAGDVTARRQFDELTTTIAAVDNLAMAGQMTAADDQPFFTSVNGELSPRVMRAIADLVAIQQVFDGHRLSATEFDEAQRQYRERIASPEWIARYLRGEPRERKEMTVLAAILSAGPAPAKESK